MMPAEINLTWLSLFSAGINFLCKDSKLILVLRKRAVSHEEAGLTNKFITIQSLRQIGPEQAH